MKYKPHDYGEFGLPRTKENLLILYTRLVKSHLDNINSNCADWHNEYCLSCANKLQEAIDKDEMI